MKEKQADVSGTKICPSCKGSGQDTTITAFTGVCGNCNGTGKVAADVSIESLAKEKYPYPENDLYKEGDPDLEEMFWVVDGLRQAFKAGYAAANQPQPHESIEKNWKELFYDWLVNNLKKASNDDLMLIIRHVEHYFIGKAAAAKDGQADYWKIRCEAAEHLLAVTDCPENEPLADNTRFLLFRERNDVWQKSKYQKPNQDGQAEEIELLKETINNQHQLILSAEKRGYDKAIEDWQSERMRGNDY